MRLLRRFVEAVGLRIAVIFIGMAVSILLARVLGPTEFGYYIFAFSVVTILSVPVQAGMPMLLTKHLPKYQVAGKRPEITGILIFAVGFIIGFCGLTYAVFWAFNTWLTSQYGTYGGQETVRLAMLLLPFIALSTTLGAAIRSLDRLFLGQVVETAMRQTFLLAMLAAIAFGGVTATLNAQVAMGLHIVAAFVTTLVTAGIVLFACGLTTGFRDARYHWKPWLIALLPLSLTAGMQVILGKSDVIMLRAIAGAEEVSTYFIANQFGNLVFLSNQAVGLVVGPMLARAAQEREMDKLQLVYARGALFVFATTLPMTVLLIFFGDPLIEILFGSEYDNVYPAMLAFSIGYVFQALFGNTEMLLKVTDHEWVVLRTTGIALIGNLALNALLIPIYGALGAAVASMAVTIAVKFTLALRIRKLVGISAFALPVFPPKTPTP